MIGYLLRRAVFRRAESATGSRTATFVRGLAIGALVGAAIAGSALWRRRRD